MTATALPPGRYGSAPTGPGRRRTVLIVVLSVVVAAAIGVLVWFGLAQGTSVSVETYGYSVKDAQSVEVTFSVTAKSGTPVVCTIEALNDAHAQVGSKDVQIPAADEQVTQYTTTVATSERAVTGVADSCRTAG
ncbi:DUF4307 domain-containing protein [Luteimicrobium sp. DT211]|uniref:DUF4307 domain-containing protein n=1 Tax=Luteimicrobium sp. DT211 TaxID=3393412 RepID=UPI003CF0C8B9